MSFLAEIIFDVIGDIFEKLAHEKPGRPSWVRVTAAVLMVVTMLLFFAYGAYVAWRKGDTVEMYICLVLLVTFLILTLSIGIRWIIRKRQEKEEWG